MKRLLTILLITLSVLFCTSQAVFAAGSSFTRTSISYLSTDGVRIDKVLITLAAVADNATGAVPNYTLNPTDYKSVHSSNGLKGYYLYEVRVDPGSTGPSNGAWDIDITGATSGLLFSNNLLDDLSSTTSAWVVFNSKYPNILENWTISIADNAVNSATATIYLLFVAN